MSVPDYPLGETIDFKFTSRAFATGIPTTLAGTPAVEIYEDNSVTQITAAETLTVDFDAVTGLNNLRIVATTGNGFEAGKSYQAVISAGTVDSVSVVGEVVAQFSIQRSPVNWANVTAPTTAVDLSATDIQLVDTVSTNTDLVSAASIADAIWDEDIVAAHGTSDTAGLILSQLTHRALATGWSTDITADSALDQIADDGTAVYDRTTDSLQAISDGGGGGPTVQQIVDGVWDESQTGHLTAGSFGLYLDSEVSGATAPTASAVADAVWDENIVAAHGTASTAGLILSQLTHRALGTGWTTDITANSALDYMADDGTAAYDRTTDSLQAISDAAPTNWSSMVISAGGAVDALTQGYMDTLLTETTSGRIAGNIDVFFENSDALTTKTVDDVGVAGSGLTQQNVRDAMKLAPTAGAPTADSVDEHLDDILADVTGIAGSAMRGTDSAATAAALATVDSNVDAILLDTAQLGAAVGASISADIAAVKAETTLIVADTNELQADWANAGRLDTILDSILADTGTDGVKLNATQPTGWAANLVASAGVIVKGTVDTVTNTHTPTTTEFQADDITEATADHFIGRIVIFTSGVLINQATDITDYAAVGGIGQFTVTALTEAPSNNDTFVIV